MKIPKTSPKNTPPDEFLLDKLTQDDYDDGIPDLYISNPSKEGLQFKKRQINAIMNGRGFSVSTRDREIRINNYVISKPHAVGKNMSFFEHLMGNPSKGIKRDDLSPFLQGEIRGKKFSKILNDLGFKSEILKAFFPKRGKGFLIFTPQVGMPVT